MNILHNFILCSVELSHHARKLTARSNEKDVRTNEVQARYPGFLVKNVIYLTGNQFVDWKLAFNACSCNRGVSVLRHVRRFKQSRTLGCLPQNRGILDH